MNYLYSISQISDILVNTNNWLVCSLSLVSSEVVTNGLPGMSLLIYFGERAKIILSLSSVDYFVTSFLSSLRDLL